MTLLLEELELLEEEKMNTFFYRETLSNVLLELLYLEKENRLGGNIAFWSFNNCDA